MDAKRLNNPKPQTLSPTTISHCSSPEFEFWMVRNPSFPQPNILSADELFVDGFLLPLHLLSTSTQNKPDPPDKTEPDSSAAITDSAAAAATFSASKRWKDIFRKSDKKNAEINTEDNDKDHKEKEKGKKKDRKGGATATTSTSAELNINIWPFSRSRSAGNAGTRPKFFPRAPGTRKVNSAPCSRSNSSGESKSRKWPSSPGRAGVHLGRSSPVWQVRRGGGSTSSKNPEPLPLNPDKGSNRETPTSRRSKLSTSSPGGVGSAKARVLNLNVPMCIGYRHHLSCRSDENSAIGVSGSSNIRDNNGGGGGGNNVGGKLFNLRSLFTKKAL